MERATWYFIVMCLVLGSTCLRAKEKYDVIVVGAGAGGISAAVQAARMGARVGLLEETDWIGGQMTAAGVSTMDGVAWNSSGFYKDFVDKIRSHYSVLGKSISTCYWGDHGVCFEPKVGQQILRDMLGRYPHIELYLRQKLVGVIQDGLVVKGVSTRAGKPWATGVGTERPIDWGAEVVIDATEYGDLLPFLAQPFRVGNALSNNPKPNACVQDITYTAIVRKYLGVVPDALYMKTPPPGYNESIRAKFAQQVTADGKWSWPIKGPINWAYHNAYRGVPDSAMPGSYTAYQPAKITRTGVNMANDFPVTVALFDRAQRKRIQCEAKLRTLQFLYYMQHDLGETAWSVADDEGYDTPYNREENSCENIPAEFKAIERNMPVMPYIRESRRTLGVHTLKAGEIKRIGSPPRGAVRFASSVALGDYAVDLHGCWGNSNFETDMERSSDVPATWTVGLFEIPLESLIPLTVDGFVAAEKNISQTRLANGATRLQPIAMMTGQAAGALAALAARQHIPPRKVRPEDVQSALRAAGAKISLDEYKDRLGLP